MSEQQKEWFVVIKYTHQCYLGEMIDAHYVEHSVTALHLTSQGPMRLGEMLRGYWAKNKRERELAIKLHDRRMTENHNWEQFMEHIEDQWLRAAHSGQC
jgi:mannosyltransferase OCH1-like enzyme